MRQSILIGCCLLLSACATTSYYTDSLKSWQGAKTSDLLKAWGKPDTVSTVAGGNTFYVYRRQTNILSNNYSPRIGINNRTNAAPVIAGMPSVNAPENRTYCFITFSAAGGKIVSESFEGTNCHINKSNANSLANPKRKAL